RAAPACIISTAQQARPKVMGHNEPVLAQFRNLSALVVMKPSFSMPSIAIFLPSSPFSLTQARQRRLRRLLVKYHVYAHRRLLPIESAFFPFVDEADGQDRQKHHDRPEPHHAQGALRHGPRE